MEATRTSNRSLPIRVENPFSLKVAQVFTGFGIGCGVGIGIGRPIYLGNATLPYHPSPAAAGCSRTYVRFLKGDGSANMRLDWLLFGIIGFDLVIFCCPCTYSFWENSRTCYVRAWILWQHGVNRLLLFTFSFIFICGSNFVWAKVKWLYVPAVELPGYCYWYVCLCLRETLVWFKWALSFRWCCW